MSAAVHYVRNGDADPICGRVPGAIAARTSFTVATTCRRCLRWLRGVEAIKDPPRRRSPRPGGSTP
jgi:hypothetical protein